jgi:hypothetical protein
MVVLNRYFTVLKELIAPAELSDPIVDGVDVTLLDKLQAVLDLQNEIAKRLNMSIQTINVNDIDFTVENINYIIETINNNFLALEEKINSLQESQEVINFDTSKEELLYFGNHKKTIQLEIDNDYLTIKTENGTFQYDVANSIMKQV